MILHLIDLSINHSIIDCDIFTFPFEPDRRAIQDSILLRVASVRDDLASSGIKAHGLMADHKLKGVLGARDKRSSHGFSRSLTMVERRIADIKILSQHLQKRLRGL